MLQPPPPPRSASNGFSPSIQAGVELDSRILDFLRGPRQLLLDGQWVDAASGRTFNTFNPATGEMLAQVTEADVEDVNRAVTAATRALNGSWGSFTPADRAKCLWRFADLMEEHADALATLESLDNGKPFAIARHGDVPFAADSLRYMAGLARGLHGETVPLTAPFQPGQRFFAYTLKEPVGVVGQIIPWNFPILMAAWKLGPALAAGCTVLLKPAEQTPLTALYLGQLAIEAGIPDGVLNVLPGYGETAGAAIAAHPGVAKVAFTGSTEVGKLIVQAAAGNLKKVTLELGGKSNTLTPIQTAPQPQIVRAFIQEYFDAWKGTDEDRIVNYYSADVVLELPTGRLIGQSAVRDQFVRPFISAFPGNVHSIQNLAHAPNLVAVEWNFEAMHRGTFADLPATGRHVRISGCSFYEHDLEARLITAGRIYFDLGTLLRQAVARLALSGPGAPGSIPSISNSINKLDQLPHSAYLFPHSAESRVNSAHERRNPAPAGRLERRPARRGGIVAAGLRRTPTPGRASPGGRTPRAHPPAHCPGP